MYQKLKEILTTLKQSNDEIQKIDFKHKAFNGKTIEAVIFLKESQPDFEVKNITGYNTDYIIKKLRSELSTAYYLPTPLVNDVIRVLSDQFYHIQIGDEIDLHRNIRYYSVENTQIETHIDCEGARLPYTFRARCVAKSFASEQCFRPNTVAKYYVKFQLIQQIA